MWLTGPESTNSEGNYSQLRTAISDLFFSFAVCLNAVIGLLQAIEKDCSLSLNDRPQDSQSHEDPSGPESWAAFRRLGPLNGTNWDTQSRGTLQTQLRLQTLRNFQRCSNGSKTLQARVLSYRLKLFEYSILSTWPPKRIGQKAKTNGTRLVCDALR